MAWRDWLDLRTLKTISRHTSGALAALISYIVISRAVEWAVGPGPFREILEYVDKTVLAVIFLYFYYRWVTIYGRRSNAAAMKNSSWLNSFKRTYAMYMTAGAAAIPAGVVYALLSVNRWERWWSDLLVLAAGLLTAHLVWRYINRRAHPSGTLAARLPVGQQSP